MATKEITEEELLALFKDKANTPPSGPNELLARHLKCKQSRELSEAVASAAHRYTDLANPRLLPPSEMLPPLA
jgi:predicted anti-sigma-YlaC factor YlaD